MSMRHLRFFVLGGLLSLGLCGSAFADTQNWSLSGSTFSGSGTITTSEIGSTGVYEITGLTGTYTSTALGLLTNQNGFTGSISLPASSFSASSPDTARYLPGALLGTGPGSDYSGNVFGDYDDLYYTGSTPHATCDGAGAAAPFDLCGLLFQVTDINGYLYDVELSGDYFDSGMFVSSGLIGNMNSTINNPIPTQIDIFESQTPVTSSTLPQSSPSVTPEPGSFALLSTGLLGVAGVVRRRYLKV